MNGVMSNTMNRMNYNMENMSTVPEFRSIGKEIEEFALKACPYMEKLLFIFFFGMLFGISHYFLLLIASQDMGDVQKWVCFVFAVWCMFNVVFNYIMTIAVDPGTPTDIQSSIIASIDHRCRTCGVKKPPRTHHCSVCKRCILQMDHHCPWVGSCVGHHNRKYFINFLTYLSIGMTELLCFMAVDFQSMIFVLLSTLLCCIGPFAVYHWYIALKGKTSLQICWDDPRYIPQQSITHNLCMVFGTSNILLCLFPSISILKNPGHQWEQV